MYIYRVRAKIRGHPALCRRPMRIFREPCARPEAASLGGLGWPVILADWIGLDWFGFGIEARRLKKKKVSDLLSPVDFKRNRSLLEDFFSRGLKQMEAGDVRSTRLARDFGGLDWFGVVVGVFI